MLSIVKKPAAKQPKAVTPEPTANEDLPSLEERASNVEAALASALDRIDGLDAEISAKITAALATIRPSMVEFTELRMGQAETRLFYQIVDYFGQCPEWELLRINEGEKHKTNGEDLFAKAFRDGWRYMGNFTHPSVITDRYTLFCRPKNGPISDAGYLKSYEDFIARRERMLRNPDTEKKKETKIGAPKLKIKAKK